MGPVNHRLRVKVALPSSWSGDDSDRCRMQVLLDSSNNVMFGPIRSNRVPSQKGEPLMRKITSHSVCDVSLLLCICCYALS